MPKGIPSNHKQNRRKRPAHIKQERRAKVSELWKQKYKMVQIAEMIGVHVSTISRDVRYLEKQWIETQNLNIGDLRNRELRELDEMEQICILRLEALIDSPTKGARWMEERLKIKQRRAQLLGIDAATKYEVNKPSQGITKEKRDEMAAAAVSKTKRKPRAENVVDMPKAKTKTKAERQLDSFLPASASEGDK
jgi:IS30 family transposase